MMTNGEFGQKIGVTDSYASYLRNGKKLPAGEVLARIIRLFNLDADTTKRALQAYEDGKDAFGAFLRDEVFMVDETEPEETQVHTG